MDTDEFQPGDRVLVDGFFGATFLSYTTRQHADLQMDWYVDHGHPDWRSTVALTRISREGIAD